MRYGNQTRVFDEFANVQDSVECVHLFESEVKQAGVAQTYDRCIQPGCEFKAPAHWDRRLHRLVRER